MDMIYSKIFYPWMGSFKRKVTCSRRKQRKAHYTASDEERRRRCSARLSKELRAKYGFRTIPLETEDVVTVKGGKFDGKTGPIKQIKLSEYKVYVEGCFVTKSNGENAMVPIYPSKLTINELFLGNGRKEQLEKKKSSREYNIEILRRKQEEMIAQK